MSAIGSFLKSTKSHIMRRNRQGPNGCPTKTRSLPNLAPPIRARYAETRRLALAPPRSTHRPPTNADVGSCGSDSGVGDAWLAAGTTGASCTELSGIGALVAGRWRIGLAARWLRRGRGEMLIWRAAVSLVDEEARRRWIVGREQSICFRCLLP